MDDKNELITTREAAEMLSLRPSSLGRIDDLLGPVWPANPLKHGGRGKRYFRHKVLNYISQLSELTTPCPIKDRTQSTYGFHTQDSAANALHKLLTAKTPRPGGNKPQKSKPRNGLKLATTNGATTAD